MATIHMRDGEWLFALLTVTLLVRATQFAPDVYVLRGLAQSLCLLVGISWLIRNPIQTTIFRYWMFFAYLLVLLSGCPLSLNPTYVLFQTFSLLAIIVFAIAIVEARFEPHRIEKITMFCLAAVCCGSLIFLIVYPDQAYLHQVFDSHRFRGLVGQPGALAAISGMLLGLAIFSHRLVPVYRTILILVSLLCLFLTGARTFWLASAVAFPITGLRYGSRKLFVAVGTMLFCVMVTLGYMLTDTAATNQALGRITRAESLGTMTGRTLLWQAAFEKFWNRPLLGYGFGRAADAFREGSSSEDGMMEIAPGVWQDSSFTMHNGYLQTLLDSGLLGALIYMYIIGIGVSRMVKYDKCRSYPGTFFVICFLAISNMGQSVIFTAAVFPSVYFWYCAVFAISLARPTCSRPLAS
jgi:O-antigen ligase